MYVQVKARLPGPHSIVRWYHLVYFPHDHAVSEVEKQSGTNGLAAGASNTPMSDGEQG